jgi:UPF0716 protein FxsA
MLSYLILLFTVLPAAELYILVKVGTYIGAFNTVLLIILTGVYGAYWARLEGLRTWVNFHQDLERGIMPADRIFDGLLILIGGVLLITPGLITDIIGFLLIFPFSRRLVKAWLIHKIKDKIDKGEGVIEIRHFRRRW